VKNEEDTYNQLKRIPFYEMERLITESFDEGRISLPPIYKFGDTVIKRDDYYSPMLYRHYALLKALEKGGWTLEDYTYESEKQAAIKQVAEFNNNLVFPQELLDRIKKFFPNATFTRAKLELE
jgi:hypothetical protein